MRELFDRVRNLYGYATAYNADPNLKHLQKLRDHNLAEFDRMIAQERAEAKTEALREAAESDDLIDYMYKYFAHPHLHAPPTVRAASSYLHNQANQIEGDND